MPIKLPDFKNTQLFWITVCAEVPSAAAELVKWMKAEDKKVAPFKAAHGTGYVRLMLGGGSGKHIHFDLFAPAMASKTLKDAPKSEMSQIQEAANRVLGKEVEANIRGGFKVKIEQLPESGIIRSLFFQTKMGNVAIKLDGAKLSIEGAPVQNISWQAAADGNVNITLEAELIKTTFSENYLTEASDLLEQSFSIFVLGKA